MERRGFVSHIAALTFGTAGLAKFDFERLMALLYPDVDTTTREIGVSDVEALEHAIGLFEQSNATYGGGKGRAAAVAHLEATLPLLDQDLDPDLRTRLQIATTHLALIAAWMSYDVVQHDATRRLLTVGLQIARATEHPHGVDLTSHLLFSMAGQALHLDRPDEAATLVQLGVTAGAGSAAVSPATRTCLALNAAGASAARGEAGACERSLGEAEESFIRIDPDAAAPWAYLSGDALFRTTQGHVWYRLARASRNPLHVQRAVQLLAPSVQIGRPVSRALYLPDFAGACALAGDVDTAVTLGHQALDATSTLASHRTLDRLGDLRSVLEPMRDSHGVAELCDRLSAA